MLYLFVIEGIPGLIILTLIAIMGIAIFKWLISEPKIKKKEFKHLEKILDTGRIDCSNPNTIVETIPHTRIMIPPPGDLTNKERIIILKHAWQTTINLRNLIQALGVIDNLYWVSTLNQIEGELITARRVIFNIQDREITNEEMPNIIQYAHNFTQGNEPKLYSQNIEYRPFEKEQILNLAKERINKDQTLREYLTLLLRAKEDLEPLSKEEDQRIEQLRDDMKWNQEENHI